ncbi:MAG: hypothetical protein V1836_00075 [Candidatus Aenigmatarchaeota archaeon]
MSFVCTDPDHIVSDSRIMQGRYHTPNEYAKWKARVLSTPLPGGTFAENVRFRLRRGTIRARYDLAMLEIEERAPVVYKVLASAGLPLPEVYRYSHDCDE